MLSKETMKPTQTEWAATIEFVIQKDQTLRFCVSYCSLNYVTRRDLYPIPRLNQSIDLLCTATDFLTLDASKGYWQIKVEADNKEKTPLTFHNGFYRFTRIHFGERRLLAHFNILWTWAYPAANVNSHFFTWTTSNSLEGLQNNKSITDAKFFCSSTKLELRSSYRSATPSPIDLLI